MLELNKIYNGDCLDVMQDIDDKSVDLILCDLPYQVLHKDNPNAQWDRLIPFEPLWEQYNRIIKDDGAIVLFAQGMFTAQLMMSNPKMWRYNLVWDKVLKTGFLNSKRMPLRQHEDICVFYKMLPTYNPQMTKCEPHKRNHSKGNGQHHEVNRCYGSYVETPTIISDEKFPTSIILVFQKSTLKESRIIRRKSLLRYYNILYVLTQTKKVWCLIIRAALVVPVLQPYVKSGILSE